jgi:radical SAM protein with 4Fe4S-binding SPASM domain
VQYLLDTIERVPVDCIFEITNACNLRCIHCEGNAGKKKTDELTTAEALALCDQLADLGTEKVHLSGGEPLLRPDWPLIAERLKSRGVAVHLITNGLLFSEAIAEQCQAVGIDMVAISIDGTMAVHDAIRRYPKKEAGPSPFRRAFEALALSRASGFPTVVITHINGWNIDELAALHQLLALVPIDGWQLQLGVAAGRMKGCDPSYRLTPSQLPKIADFIADHQHNPFRILTADNIGYFNPQESLLRPYDDRHFPFFTGCMAGILGVAIGPEGTVKGCPSMGEAMAEGNVRERPLGEIWENREGFAYNRCFDSRRLKGFCRQCDFRHLCRAGCTSHAAALGSCYENDFCLHRVSKQQAESEDSAP